jgi:TRAP transporter 4TM/12TM fusion protein
LAGLTLAACWAASGLHFVALIAVFLILGFSMQFADGKLATPPISMQRYVMYLTFGGEGFLGNALRVISKIVVVFIGFGVVLNMVGASKVIEKIAILATRKSRGAAIKVAVIASALFGTISGSATSNVMTSGTFSITSMRKLGLSGAQAGGVEAVASTLGQVIPPIMGAAAFLMADFTNLPYLTIAKAAALPAVICVIFLFISADNLAVSLVPKDQTTVPEGQSLVLRDALYLLPVIGVLGSFILRPDKIELAGITGMALGFVAGFLHNGATETFAQIKELPMKAGQAVGNLVVTASALGCIIAVLALTGFDVLLSRMIGDLGDTSLFLSLLLCAVAAIILGTGMATSGVYIVVAIMLAPGLIKLGVPVLAAHMFVFYFSVISMITPPVAFAVLAASGLTGAGFYRTGFAAIRFGWILFVMPFLIVYFPGILLIGAPVEIVRDILTVAAFGVVAWLIVRTRDFVSGLRRP